jgi:hypothetical protein
MRLPTARIGKPSLAPAYLSSRLRRNYIYATCLQLYQQQCELKEVLGSKVRATSREDEERITVANIGPRRWQ